MPAYLIDIRVGNVPNDDARLIDPIARVLLVPRLMAGLSRTAAVRGVGNERLHPTRCRRSLSRDGHSPSYAFAAETGYSMTSSARASSDCGSVRPSALAVFRLTTSSNRVGRSTGRSAGRAPARIRAM
jgi:hypothetical protein